MALALFLKPACFPRRLALVKKTKQKHPRARNEYDEEAAYESYMNPEPGSQSGPKDYVDAD